MGIVIENHPRMVKMWTKRVREAEAAWGRTVANKWATSMFNPEQIALINTELKKSVTQKG